MFDDDDTIKKLVLMMLAVLATIMVIGWVFRAFTKVGNSYVDREVFEQSPSFIHGKNNYIARLCHQHDEASVERAESLRRLILEEANDIDNDHLTPQNQRCVSQLR